MSLASAYRSKLSMGDTQGLALVVASGKDVLGSWKSTACRASSGHSYDESFS